MARKRTKADDVAPEVESESPAADLQRPPAEVLFAAELARLAEQDAGKPRPKGWRLTPQSVVRFVLGDEALGIAPKFVGRRSFLERAPFGQLPPVSWIDPNFVDLGFGPAGSNDDHPPSDLHAGQRLVLALFDALVRSPAWEKTLALVVYDEHGGFYDHVAPPEAEDDFPGLRSYGPRVPAIVISPWVEEGQVASTLFDHSSIVKTILARFCRRGDGTVPDMGARVRAAAHLGGLLTRGTPRAPIPGSDYQALVDQAKGWQEQLVAHPVLGTREGIVAPPPELTDFQQEFLAARATVLLEEGGYQNPELISLGTLPIFTR